jgi:prepilin-type N-terminal cleavage/methylation domain-containing protein
LERRVFRKGIKMIARKGFTLVELLLVVLIIAILASIVVPRLTGAAAEANKSKCDANWANLIRALELYAANNNGAYPATDALFQSSILNSSIYFPHGAPVCPFSTAYVYVGDATGGTVTAHSH